MDDLDGDIASGEDLFKFIQDCGNGFLDSYLPIIKKRACMPYTNAEKKWQQIRRGRYVEFNLVCPKIP